MVPPVSPSVIIGQRNRVESLNNTIYVAQVTPRLFTKNISTLLFFIVSYLPWSSLFRVNLVFDLLIWYLGYIELNTPTTLFIDITHLLWYKAYIVSW